MNHYKEVANLTDVIYTAKLKVCDELTFDDFVNMCEQFDIKIGVYTEEVKNALLPKYAVPNALNEIVSNAETTAKEVFEAESTRIAAEITEQQTAVINATYSSWQIAITASVIAIVTKKKNEEKTPIYQIIRRIDVITLLINKQCSF
ncbi:hypothetical protein PFFVO_01583 [Plasmodium falciparum Vietnam Oak-Knoll (FVO)]|uniref:Uncharacterized protein n=1 Tax=Plasmodium falciparum Vietnam Oak-Knoll (FVO) TaxID=1036723 RepID=A0A024V9A3_PLAFA|nr:hypothetical protein PFFVO_01583 [Plasmodium falciparum Vietnam Oak-Knoll (FVO)]